MLAAAVAKACCGSKDCLMDAVDGRRVGLLRTWWPMLATLLALVAGGVLALAGRSGAADLVWGVSIAGVTVSLAVEIVQQLRRRQPGVDVIALLAMVGAIWCSASSWPGRSSRDADHRPVAGGACGHACPSGADGAARRRAAAGAPPRGDDLVDVGVERSR
jgi:hypothetical protein